MPQRIEVKIPWSKADKKAKGDLLCCSLKRQFTSCQSIYPVPARHETPLDSFGRTYSLTHLYVHKWLKNCQVCLMEI